MIIIGHDVGGVKWFMSLQVHKEITVIMEDKNEECVLRSQALIKGENVGVTPTCDLRNKVS